MKKAAFTILISLLCGWIRAASPDIIYPADLEAVVDVTKPPYNADPTGQTDCTAALIRAVDDVLRPDREALKETLRTIKEKPELAFWYRKLPFNERQQFLQKNPLAAIGQQRSQAIFPYKSSPAKIIYFPKGTYLVSDTITYSYDDLVNKQGLELNWRLHFRGQNRDGTVIRLKENSAGFGSGTDKPVVSFLREGRRSNVAMQNSFEYLTIEVGPGNPGASGLNFFANNCGVVRRVAIRSDGPEQAGCNGLEINGKSSTGMLLSDVQIEGFDCGIKIEGQSDTDNAVIEHATLSGQHVAGVLLKDRNASLRCLTSSNAVSAVRLEGSATLAVLDSELTGTGAAGKLPAIDLKGGCLLARDVDTAGYGQAVVQPGQTPVATGMIREYLSHPWRHAFDDSRLPDRLPVEETPAFPWPEQRDWVSVNSCGAKGDGFTDDTAAIQAAMNAGKPAVYFQSGTYLIDGTITIPSAVERVNFMYADLVSGGHLLEQTNGAAFRVEGETLKPLLLEDLFGFELFYGPRLVEHASRRTLVLSDLHTQAARMYFNSVPGGKVFIENCASAVPNDAPLPGGFTFTGQQVWARQLNPERTRPMVLNQGSKLWILGFRTEARNRTGFVTTDGGTTELMGGHFSFHGSGEPAPQVISRDSSTTVFCAAMSMPPSLRPKAYRPVEDTRNGETNGVEWTRFPSLRPDEAAVIYSGDNRPSASKQTFSIDAH
ncbi:MAG: glycosyl hydrolase family 28-related protein [Kiritimatiellales bacterium]